MREISATNSNRRGFPFHKSFKIVLANSPLRGSHLVLEGRGFVWLANGFGLTEELV